MFSLFFAANDDELVAELYDAGTLGIVEEAGGLRAFFEGGSDAAALLARFGPVQRLEPDVDWEQSTHDSFPAFAIGRRFFLAPPWSEAPTPPGRLRLVIEPGMACGTGWHPCTQLCLQAMEEHLKPGDMVLDVGCGSGILSEAAWLLGAANVISCDIDPDAAGIARARFVGSVDAVRGGSAGLIVANISSAVVEELAAELQRARKPGATLILSGFEGDDLPRLPFAVREKRTQAAWTCLVC